MKPKLGTGARFKALTKKVGSPALAAYIGRKKFGKKKFQSLAKKGKRKVGPVAMASKNMKNLMKGAKNG